MEVLVGIGLLVIAGGVFVVYSGENRDVNAAFGGMLLITLGLLMAGGGVGKLMYDRGQEDVPKLLATGTPVPQWQVATSPKRYPCQARVSAAKVPEHDKFITFQATVRPDGTCDYVVNDPRRRRDYYGAVWGASDLGRASKRCLSHMINGWDLMAPGPHSRCARRMRGARNQALCEGEALSHPEKYLNWTCRGRHPVAK